MVPATPRAIRPGPRIEEARPWQSFNTDGSRNLGSYEVIAAEGMVLLAHELLLARAKETGRKPSPGQVQGLARRLLFASDAVQAGVRTDGRVARMDGSHARARAAVRVALDVHPVAWGAGPTELDAWMAELSIYALALLSASVALAEMGPQH